MVDGEELTEVYGGTGDYYNYDCKTVTGAAVVACTAGATVYVAAPAGWEGIGVYAYNSDPITTFSGFLLLPQSSTI